MHVATGAGTGVGDWCSILRGPLRSFMRWLRSFLFPLGKQKGKAFIIGSDLLLVKGGLIGFNCSGPLAGAYLRVEQY